MRRERGPCNRKGYVPRLEKEDADPPIGFQSRTHKIPLDKTQKKWCRFRGSKF